MVIFLCFWAKALDKIVLMFFNKIRTFYHKKELQKEKSKSYETVETWTSSKTGTLLSVSESRNINVLCNYRLKVTFTAGKETEVVYKYH